MFLTHADRGCYVSLLDFACRNDDVALHANVLMGNHVHLLVPEATVERTLNRPAADRLRGRPRRVL